MALNQGRLVFGGAGGGGGGGGGGRERSKIHAKGGEQKRGEGKQRFKKGAGQAGSRGGCLKRGGWTFHMNYDICMYVCILFIVSVINLAW